ncbi:MAG: UbiH/UbiF family hydroxylase [Burkholderiales bacterium]|nr:UbiH/UbiF family hydroxylase [Burkholderiales bacterium]
MQEQEFDVVVIGGGLVGISLVAALDGSGLRIALVDAAPAPPGPARPADPDLPKDWDVRVYAINPGSERFLTSIGAWPGASDRIAPVLGMRVRGDASGGRIDFDAREAGTAHLACIVESRLLMQALGERLDAMHDLFRWRCAGAQFELEDRRALLHLDNGTVLHARLLVGADGARSWLRAQAGIAASVKPYGQTAVVANFTCAKPHAGLAWQWFRPDGVLALLPLPGRRCSMVWSANAALADELMALDAGQLASRVTQAAGETLGPLEVLTDPAAFPLQLVRVSSLVQPRLALVGDAAHNLHPLAGQGVNLGFQDAQELARVLRDRGACHDVGQHRLLRAYERARREDILAMTLATDGLQRLFGHSAAPLRWIRNGGLTLVDRALPLKRLLIRQALG